MLGFARLLRACVAMRVCMLSNVVVKNVAGFGRDCRLNQIDGGGFPAASSHHLITDTSGAEVVCRLVACGGNNEGVQSRW